MERGVQQADDHRPGSHDPQDPVEIGGLKLPDLVQSFVKIPHGLRGVRFIFRTEYPVVALPAPGLRSLGVQQHLAHRRQALWIQEHVLGAAEADAFRAHDQGLGCV